MNDKKQNEKQAIKEMAKTIGSTWIVDLEGNPHDLSEVLTDCDIENIAEQLYERNYRKQEQISIEEALSEECTHTIVCDENGAVDKFRLALMDKFIDLCGGNDYNKINLLLIGETVDQIYDKCIDDMRKEDEGK